MTAKAMAKTRPKLRSDPISISWCFPGGSIIGLENSSWTAYPGVVDDRQHRWLSHAAHRGPEHQTFARRGLDPCFSSPTLPVNGWKRVGTSQFGHKYGGSPGPGFARAAEKTAFSSARDRAKQANAARGVLHAWQKNPASRVHRTSSAVPPPCVGERDRVKGDRMQEF